MVGPAKFKGGASRAKSKVKESVKRTSKSAADELKKRVASKSPTSGGPRLRQGGPSGPSRDPLADTEDASQTGSQSGSTSSTSRNQGSGSTSSGDGRVELNPPAGSGRADTRVRQGGPGSRSARPAAVDRVKQRIAGQQGVESQSGVVGRRARRLEQQALQEAGLEGRGRGWADDTDYVRIQREGDTLRAEYTQRGRREAVTEAILGDHPGLTRGDIDVRRTADSFTAQFSSSYRREQSAILQNKLQTRGRRYQNATRPRILDRPPLDFAADYGEGPRIRSVEQAQRQRQRRGAGRDSRPRVRRPAVRSQVQPQQREEQFGDIPIYIGERPGRVVGANSTPMGVSIPAGMEASKQPRRLESYLRDASEAWSGVARDVGDSMLTSSGMTADDVMAYRPESIRTVSRVARRQDTQTPPNAGNKFLAGTAEGAVQMTNVPSVALGVKEGVEFVGYAGQQIGKDLTAPSGLTADDVMASSPSSPKPSKNTDQLVTDVYRETGDITREMKKQFSTNPARSAGQLAGSLLLSAGAIGAASKVSSTASRATAFAIQPGEEIATVGLNRFAPAAVRSKFPGGRIDNEEIIIQQGRRGASYLSARSRQAFGHLARKYERFGETGRVHAGVPVPRVEVETEVEQERDHGRSDWLSPELEEELRRFEENQRLGVEPERFGAPELETEMAVEQELARMEAALLEREQQVQTPTVFEQTTQRLDTELRTELDQTLETELAMETTLEGELETELEMEQELERELVTELALEMEMEQELELETELELEQELELEAEASKKQKRRERFFDLTPPGEWGKLFRNPVATAEEVLEYE